MRRAFIAAILAVAFLGCNDTSVNTGPDYRVPASVLPAGPEDTAGIERLIAWAETHPMPKITKNCAMQGPSLCNEAYSGVLFCKSVCGFTYWQLSSGCIVAATGESMRCP